MGFASMRVTEPYDVVSKEKSMTHIWPSCPLRTLPGLRTNDAMAGFLAHRSMHLAVFPESPLQ